MQLIGQFGSPFVRRVGIALHHYRLPFEHRPWSVWAHAEDVARFNPLRRVPVLVLGDGEILVESGAILDALDDMVSDEQRLIPRSGPARRATLRVCALATGLADKAVSLLYERVLRGERGTNKVWTDRCTAQIEHTLDLLETERVARPGEHWFGALSHADIAVACALRFSGEAHPDLVAGLRTRPALMAHAEQCERTALFRGVSQALHVAV
jgi:glutathione S-transferase